MTIGGVQDDQFNLNSTKKNIFQNLIWKNLQKIRFQIFFNFGHPSFYSTPNECFKTVFAFSVPQPKKKSLPFEVFISIG